MARNTVADAYGQLVAEGWLTAPGTGSGHPGRRAQRPPPRPRAGQAVTAAAARAARGTAYDLRPGSPDLSAFPRAAWLAAARRALTAAPARPSATATRAAAPSCARPWPTTWPAPAACAADPDRIVVCAGFGQGLALLSRVLRARGATTLAVEELRPARAPGHGGRGRAAR